MKSLHQKIYLIRHGETEWTKTRRHTGLTDIPLTDEGRQQAQWLKEALSDVSFKKVFCSPLVRAKETCEIAGFFKQAVMDEDLFEWDYGDYEGLTTAEIKEKVPKWNLFTNGVSNGESIGDIGARAQRMLGKAQAVQGDVALFSSGHFSRVLAAKWLHLPPTDGKLFALSTASISVLGYEHESPVLYRWNQTREF